MTPPQPTDPETMREIKDVYEVVGPGSVMKAETPEGVVLATAQGVMKEAASMGKECRTKLEHTATAATLPILENTKLGLRTLFTRDESIPLKGVWFKAVEVEEEKLVLIPTHFTKKFSKGKR